MNIAIIDAELLANGKNRFPNLALMKISGYYKALNNNVILKLDYNDLENFDKVFISKVFTSTNISEDILKFPNVSYGGTGFFYDKAEPLPNEIEHHMPDYSLYDDWVSLMLKKGIKANSLEAYTDFSIGFTTRGCFRKCQFCVNKNYDRVYVHSPISEFLDEKRKYICLLDDNILGYSNWKSIISELKSTNKAFQYKQGMDERLMTDEKAKILNDVKYRGHYIFAFDNIDDAEVIKKKLKIWKSNCNKTTKLYVLCGFDRNDKYDEAFWKQDIIDTFERIKILMEHGCIPYIMRYEKYNDSPYRGTYINLSSWCNQPQFYHKMSYKEYCQANQDRTKSGVCSTFKYSKELENKYPEISNEYYNIKYYELNKY